MAITPLKQDGPTVIEGFAFSGIHAGIKKDSKKLDLALIQVTSPEPAQVAALFTTNLVQAAPVLHAKNQILNGKCRAILINSGNANACTGEKGLKDSQTLSQLIAKDLGCSHKEVFVSSTGVIGQHLPMEKIEKALPSLTKNVKPANLPQAARAIHTTDTFDKVFGTTFPCKGKTLTLSGIAKGAGMIQPHMATMLAFLFCDGNIPSETLQKALLDASNHTFNCMTVDGEMSTNDSVFLLANGMAKNDALTPQDKDYAIFVEHLSKCCDYLAQQIIRDGEGISKFVELNVSGLEDEKALKEISLAIANSYLVRTALCGEDPNWGRILSAAGACAARLGLDANFDRASISFNDVYVFQEGIPQGKEAEGKATQIMKKEVFQLNVALGTSGKRQKIYTSDLTADYVRINADYRT